MAGEEGKTHTGEDRERAEIKHGGRDFYSLDKRKKQGDNETEGRDSPYLLARVPLALKEARADLTFQHGPQIPQSQDLTDIFYIE